MKASKLLEIVNEHIGFYGDTDVDVCSASGDSFKITHWDHYKDSLFIEVKEEEDEDE